MGRLDAVVVGSGPNGLAAALTLARSGLEVRVIEGAAEPGGGCRTAELTLPGYRHDICSAVHPLLVASPFFGGGWLEARGVTLLQPQVAFAHPLDGGRAAAVRFSPGAAGALDSTATGDRGYQRLVGPVVARLASMMPDLLAPLRAWPSHPLALARLALPGLLPATTLARAFEDEATRALFAGAAAHSMLPLSRASTGAYGLLFTALGHRYGWPVVRGGSQSVADALLGELSDLGVEVHTGRWVTDLAQLPQSRVTVLDVGPEQLVALAGDRLGSRYSAALRRYRRGPGVFKVDWALSGPVPWEAGECRSAGTVHVGGSMEQVARAEAEVAAGRHPQEPFCLVAQPSVVDPTRAPAGRHTLWGYCHVPNGSGEDMTERVERQVERFAPGFRDLVLARQSRTASQLEQYNPNYAGGDIGGGAASLRQVLMRPAPRWDNYRAPVPGLFTCSAATPPGAGVHGMCGYWAAQSALAYLGVTGSPRAAGRLRVTGRPGPVAG